MYAILLLWTIHTNTSWRLKLKWITVTAVSLPFLIEGGAMHSVGQRQNCHTKNCSEICITPIPFGNVAAALTRLQSSTPTVQGWRQREEKKEESNIREKAEKEAEKKREERKASSSMWTSHMFIVEFVRWAAPILTVLMNLPLVLKPLLLLTPLVLILHLQIQAAVVKTYTQTDK